MTVTTTVGFGDITPTSHLARNVADVQMFVDLVALAAALRALHLGGTAVVKALKSSVATFRWSRPTPGRSKTA